MTEIITAVVVNNEREITTVDLERSRLAMCDICDAEAYAPESVLREMKWEFGPSYEFCPAH